MAPFTILHVGNDTCQRIPVMRTASFVVLQSEDSVPAILKAFLAGDSFSAITFDADISAPSSSIAWAVRRLPAAPLVLFENPSVSYDRSYFDLVIPTLTPPKLWLKKLHDVIEASREQCERSRRLRQEYATIFSALLETRAAGARVPVNPIDI
jgi:hypothetical protein